MATFKLKDLKVVETALVDRGAGKGVRICLYKRRDEVPGEDRIPIEMRCKIEKYDAPKRQVFGWFSIAKTGKDAIEDVPPNTAVLDHHGHIIEVEDLEAAAYDYLIESRVASEMHEKSDPSDPSTIIKRGTCIESCVFTLEKQKAMGLEPGTLPIAWWGGHVVDADTFAKVVSGELQEFSIAGTAMKVPVEKSAPPQKDRSMSTTIKGLWTSLLEKLGTNVSKDLVGTTPKTCGQMMQDREVSEKMYELNRCFVSSMYSILDGSTGKPQLELMKQNVTEYGAMLEKMIPGMTETEKSMARDSMEKLKPLHAAVDAAEDAMKQEQIVDVRKALGEVPVGEPTNKENKVMKRTPAQIIKSLSNKEAITDDDKAVLKAAGLLDEEPTKVDDIVKSLDPKVSEIVKAALAEKDSKIDALTASMEKLTSTVEKLSATAAEQADKSVNAACEAEAKKYVGLGYKAEELAKTLKTLRSVGGTAHADFTKGLDVAVAKAKAANRSIVREEIGGDDAEAGEVSAYAQLQAIAKKIADEKKIPVEKAMGIAMAQNADLYAQSTQEQAEELERFGSDDE